MNRDTITLPRSVVEQALEVFEEVAQWESDGDPSHPASRAIEALRAALEQPQVEQQTRYLAGGARYKVTHLAFAGYCIHGLPREMLGQWVAFVDATDNKHMDSLQPPVATDRQYPLPDDLYGGSKDWRAGSYHERVEWLHLGYESLKERIAELEQPQVEQEPVAAQCRFEGEFEWRHCTVAHHLHLQAHPKKWPHYETRALYTHPQSPRQPLTDEEIDGLLENVIGSLPVARNLIRAIERAHGIGGEA